MPRRFLTPLALVTLIFMGTGLFTGTGLAYDTYVPMNGGFERYDEAGIPLGWALEGTPSADGLPAEARLADDAWKGERALYVGSQGTGTASGVMEIPIAFSVLRMLYMGTCEFHYKALSSGLSGSNLVFGLDLLDKNGEVVASVKFSPPPDQVGDDSWHLHRFSVDILESRAAKFMRISFSVNRDQEKAPGAWVIDELQIFEAPSSLRFSTLRCRRALLRRGQKFRVEMNLSNVGGAFFYDLHSVLELDEGLRSPEGNGKVIGVVEPGVNYVLSWDLVADESGIYSITVHNWAPQNATPNRQLMAVVVAAADFPQIEGRAEGARSGRVGNEVLLENPLVRLVFPFTSDGFGVFAIYSWNGSWVPMGISMPMGHAIYLSDSGRKELLLLTPSFYSTGHTADSAWLELWGDVTDVDGVSWTVNYRFGLSSADPYVNVSFAALTSRKRRILRLSGPQVLAGEGSFGSDRDEGLFCGLEYLQPGERSSGTDFVDPPKNIRTVPNPLKVTAPLMVVEKDGASIAVSWNPLEKWDGTNSEISAEYLSPNWVQNQSNHVMELFIPTVPNWVQENEDEAYKPYVMEGAIRMTFKIFAKSNASVIDVFRWWLDLNGAPDPPEKPRSYEETIDLCTECYKDVCWVPQAKAWKHTYLDDPSWIFWDPLVALPLWHESALTENLTLREEIRSQVMEALEARGGRGATLDLALHLGEMDKTLESGYDRVRALADSQREDGSWPFTPQHGKERLGKAEDTSSGWVANKARFLLKFGRITGDSEAIQAGFKALNYLDTQRRPEGAQTWELQLHVPDVLASSYVMECYLEAYKISKDPKYLEKAKYWALTGLPFIYMWNPADRPIMRYGSIPVFGASMYTNPWFGTIVQWNGLDYAYKLYDLSRYDDSLPWRTFSEGITICGMQMQRYPGGPHEEVMGMYPDGYSATMGKDAYYFDINPRFTSLCAFALSGNDEVTQTQIIDVDGERVHFSTVGHLYNASASGKTLSFDVQYPEGDTSLALVGCISKASSVSVNGRTLNETDDLSKVTEGWTYRAEGILIIKIVHSAMDHVEMEGVTAQPNQRFAPEPEWNFEEGTEGWTNTNMLTPFKVEEGILSSASTGGDPYMVGPSIRVEGRGDCSAEIRMSVSAGATAQMFWVRKDSPYYSEPKSMSFKVQADGQFHTYTIKLGESPEWTGIIRQLRFDPTNVKDAIIHIDYIRIKEPLLLAILGSLLPLGFGAAVRTRIALC